MCAVMTVSVNLVPIAWMQVKKLLRGNLTAEDTIRPASDPSLEPFFFLSYYISAKGYWPSAVISFPAVQVTLHA